MSRRSGRAVFPHPALGQGSTRLDREISPCGSPPSDLERFDRDVGRLAPLSLSISSAATSLNSDPFPPPELLGFPGTTSPSATPGGPACPSRASGWGFAPHRWGFPCCRGIPCVGMPSPLPRWDRWVKSFRDEGLPAPRCSPATAAFPVKEAGRLPRCTFRGLLGVHLRYGLPTRRAARRHVCLEGSDGFVTSAAAPIASGWKRSNLAGWDSHPLGNRTLSRRTLSY